MAPGARNKFGAPVFESKVFRKQLYCIEESICGIPRSFRRPHSDSLPGELCSPCLPRYASASTSLARGGPRSFTSTISIIMTWCHNEKFLPTPLNVAPQNCFQSGPALAKAGPALNSNCNVQILCFQRVPLWQTSGHTVLFISFILLKTAAWSENKWRN